MRCYVWIMAHIQQVYPRVQDGVCLGFMSSEIDESYRLKKTTYLKNNSNTNI